MRIESRDSKVEQTDVRATRGLVFLKEMTPDEFFRSYRELRKSVENA